MAVKNQHEQLTFIVLLYWNLFWQCKLLLLKRVLYVNYTHTWTKVCVFCAPIVKLLESVIKITLYFVLKYSAK